MTAIKNWMLIIFIIPTISFTYTLSEKTRAHQIIQLSENGGLYHPKVKINKNNNQKGKSDVYQDEYGVVVTVTNKDLIANLKKANEIAYKNSKFIPTNTPHVTIIQGVYRGNKLSQLEKAMKVIAEETFQYKVTMQKYFTQGGGGNTFLNVSDGGYFFDRLTKYMSNSVLPDAPMKQTIDDIKSGVADLKEMHDGGAWRDFNLPYNNNPHITVVYGKNNPVLLSQLNKLPKTSLSFMAKCMSIYQIDEVGNLYGKPLYQVKFKSNL
jgi:2'-5' RNA ligase